MKKDTGTRPPEATPDDEALPTRPLTERMARLGQTVAIPSWIEQRNDIQVRTLFRSEKKSPTPPREPLPVATTPVPLPYVPPPPSLEERLTAATATAKVEARRAAQAELAPVLQRYLDGLERLIEATRLARRPRTADVIDLALVVAREILGHEARVDRDGLVGAVDEALRSVRSDTEIHLRLPPADLEHLDRSRPDLVDGGLVLEADETLPDGSWVIETPKQLIDGTLAARIDAVRQALVDVLELGGDLDQPDDRLEGESADDGGASLPDQDSSPDESVEVEE